MMLNQINFALGFEVELRFSAMMILALAWLQPAAAAAEEPANPVTIQAPTALPPAVQLLKTETEEAWKAYATHALTTQKKTEKALDLALHIARTAPTRDQGFEAFAWWLTKARENRSVNLADELVELGKLYADQPGLGPVLAQATASRSEHDYQLEQFCKLVLEINPDSKAKGAAAFALARTKRWQTLRTMKQANPSGDHLDAATDAGAKAFVELVEKYGAQPDLSPGADGRTLAESARPYLFQLQRLRPGKQAPEIIGVDIAGNPLKLSDFRGKVVYLIFWNSADPRDFVSLSAMSERLRDRPFAVVGVNTDADRAVAERTERKYALPWRSFHDGTASQKDSIAETWNARDPNSTYYYLIDEQGTFQRLYYAGNTVVEKQIEEFVSKAEKRQ